MVVKHKRKIRRKRGSRKCGYGRNHRGSGRNAGKGNAGSGKRSDTAKRSYPADYFGKCGFLSHNSTPVNAITCRDVEAKLDSWVDEKNAAKEGDHYVVDLAKLGYDKLIGTGIRRKMRIKVAKTSEGVVEHLKESGSELA